MAELKIPVPSLDTLLLKHKKTYIAGILAIISGVAGYFGYADPAWAEYAAIGLIAAAIIFSRMATSDTQKQLAEALALLNELSNVPEDPEESK